MVKLSIVLPTIGRPSLARTLRSIQRQTLEAGDEVMIVTDGHSPLAEHLWRQFRLPGRLIEVPGPYNDWGHTPRNIANLQAQGTHIVAMDDDDEFAPDALKTIRSVASENPDRPLMFRMHEVQQNRTLWQHQSVVHGNVGTPMFVTPNDRRKLGQFRPVYGGDKDFMLSTLSFYPTNSLIWRDEVIALIRPH